MYLSNRFKIGDIGVCIDVEKIGTLKELSHVINIRFRPFSNLNSKIVSICDSGFVCNDFPNSGDDCDPGISWSCWREIMDGVE